MHCWDGEFKPSDSYSVDIYKIIFHLLNPTTLQQQIKIKLYGTTIVRGINNLVSLAKIAILLWTTSGISHL